MQPGLRVLHDPLDPRPDALQADRPHPGRGRELAADGAVELNLIGQDTTSYGTDIGYAARALPACSGRSTKRA